MSRYLPVFLTSLSSSHQRPRLDIYPHQKHMSLLYSSGEEAFN